MKGEFGFIAGIREMFPSPDAESALAVPHTVIGRITEGNSLIWKGSDMRWLLARNI